MKKMIVLFILIGTLATAGEKRYFERELTGGNSFRAEYNTKMATYSKSVGKITDNKNRRKAKKSGTIMMAKYTFDEKEMYEGLKSKTEKEKSLLNKKSSIKECENNIDKISKNYGKYSKLPQGSKSIEELKNDSNSNSINKKLNNYNSSTFFDQYK